MGEMETGIRGDLEWGSIPHLARAAAVRFGDGEAVVDGDVRLSFAELAAAAARPIDDHRSTAAYRRHAIGVLARRLIRRAFP